MDYDYIFCGFGMSNMVLLESLAAENLLDGKTILIIEKELDCSDKTWCFWETGSGKWDHLLSGRWDRGSFKTSNFTKEILDGYTYKSVGSKQLNVYLKNILINYSCSFKHEKLCSYLDNGSEVSVNTDKATYRTKLFFNCSHEPQCEAIKSKLLLQHFEGYYIECASSIFNDSEATIMDFSVAQKGNTRFMYVLPFTDKSALVEYTLFSQSTLEKHEYRQAVVDYLRENGITNYTITKMENGIVPMSGHPYWKKNSRNVLHTGTAGGWTKASSGYTFERAQILSSKVVSVLKSGNIDFRHFHKSSRFEFYDKLFIDVLYSDNSIGKQLFTRLFLKSKSNVVLKFLKEQTNFREELSIILSCPKLPFLKALFRSLFYN